MSKKMRADQILADQGLAESREKAKRLVMAGRVYLISGDTRERVDKPGRQLSPDAVLEVEEPRKYVSRGGEKLETAIEHFGIDPAGKVCLDAGASTGGFTDCLLQHGAAKVYAADVGKGQLDVKLREDPRVVNLEKTNLRDAAQDLIPEPVDMITADVSFISLSKVLPPCLKFLRPGGELLALVKPQFELWPGAAVKGVVRDEKLQKRAVVIVVDLLVNEHDMEYVGFVPSKIKGPKGNQEYLIYLKNPVD
jgi:23S rRNA (cytidine1920-2'-O)/16S rRNA (cytidine1409-2'-O)-methyltransferase